MSELRGEISVWIWGSAIGPEVVSQADESTDCDRGKLASELRGEIGVWIWGSAFGPDVVSQAEYCNELYAGPEKEELSGSKGEFDVLGKPCGQPSSGEFPACDEEFDGLT